MPDSRSAGTARSGRPADTRLCSGRGNPDGGHARGGVPEIPTSLVLRGVDQPRPRRDHESVGATPVGGHERMGDRLGTAVLLDCLAVSTFTTHAVRSPATQWPRWGCRGRCRRLRRLMPPFEPSRALSDALSGVRLQTITLAILAGSPNSGLSAEAPRLPKPRVGGSSPSRATFELKYRCVLPPLFSSTRRELARR
jgi:hypothetical protein